MRTPDFRCSGHTIGAPSSAHWRVHVAHAPRLMESIYAGSAVRSIGTPILTLRVLALIPTRIVGEVTPWSEWTRSPAVFGILVAALLADPGLLSWVFLGDREAWPKWAFTCVAKVFSTPLATQRLDA